MSNQVSPSAGLKDSEPDRQLFEALRSERRWAFAEAVAKWVVGTACAIFCVGLVAAAYLVLTVPECAERGVMDGQQ